VVPVVWTNHRSVTACEIYASLHGLGGERAFIENQLARRHLKRGGQVLYDVTSTYLEERCCLLERSRR
jgi:hypothetical protein